MKAKGLKEGCSVVVKKGVKDPDTGENIAGWQGRVLEISEDEGYLLIQWDSISLKEMSDEMIRQCEEEGLDWSEMGLGLEDVALTKPRDDQSDVDALIEEIGEKFQWAHLGEEGQRIQAVLDTAEEEDDPEFAEFAAWEKHLKGRLTFPFSAYVSEFQEGGPLRTLDDVKVLGIEGWDDPFGVLVWVRRSLKKILFPLCDLEVSDKASPNYRLVKDYAVWFANR